MLTNISFPLTRERLTSDLDDGLFTRGAQVVVMSRGEAVLDIAVGDDGMGHPMTSETVMRVYCAIKPVTSIAVAHLVDAGRLDLDMPLRDVLDGPRAVADGRVRLRHVLDHTVGVHRPMALAVEVLPPHARVHAADGVEQPPGWVVGRNAAYSEWYGWALLGRVIEAVTGSPLRDHLRAAVLEPLGLSSTWIGMTSDEYRAVLPRLGVNLDMRTDRTFPLLLERGERMCTETNNSHGGYSTATDLAALFAALLRGLDGKPVPGLPSLDTLRTFTSPQRPTSFDEVLDRTCTFGYGFMTGLSDHAFGSRCSDAAFGHSGIVGSTFAFADPEISLAVGVVFNGVVDPDSAFVRRPALVRAIYRDLEEAETQTLENDERPRRRLRGLRRRG